MRIEIEGTEYEGDVSMTQNTIRVSNSRPTPDPGWVHVDSEGHEHRYEHGYPTLEQVIDKQHRCDGNEGAFNHDHHMAIDEAHFECVRCREVVEPGLRPAGWVDTIPTTREFTVTVWGSFEFARHRGSLGDMLGEFVPISMERDGKHQVSTFAFVPS